MFAEDLKRTEKMTVDDVFEQSAQKIARAGHERDRHLAVQARIPCVGQREGERVDREDAVEPLHGVRSFHDVYKTIDHDKAVHAFAKTAFLKLNGGLGTSMGLQCAKSLLPVRRHKARQMRFLDIILGQVLTARTRLNAPLPVTFMNSFRTSDDTMKALRHQRKFKQTDIPLEIIQHQEPKIDAATGAPASWPANPDSGVVPARPRRPVLYAAGVRPAGHSAGAWLRIPVHLELRQSGCAPVSHARPVFRGHGRPVHGRGRQSHVRGPQGWPYRARHGHRSTDLREMSQVHPDDKDAAQDIAKHPYFNTNNIWVRIDVLRDMLAEHDGVLSLPVIINNKTVDPTDPQSPAVVQLETAMGAAIGLFEGAICVQVDRMRFLPVKTTNDLFIMRSDRFHLTDSYEMEDGNYIFPNVDLDPRYYKNIEDFNERFPYNVPSLAAANSVSIKGDWTFGRDVIMFADARLEDRNEPSYVPNGEYVGPMGIEPGDWV